MSENEPDLSKPLSRWAAPYWAMSHGITAVLEPAEWAVLCALYSHLPNVRPGRGRLEMLTGVSTSTIKRAKKAMRDIGLFTFRDGPGGSPRDSTTCYTVADIRVRSIADAIIAKRTGSMMNPVHHGPGPL